MFKRKIVNADDDRTGTKRRRRKLHVQHVDRMFAQLGAECQRDSDQRRVRQRGLYFEIGPALVETIVSFAGRDVESVIVYVIDLRERFDKVNGVAFVSRKL